MLMVRARPSDLIALLLARGEAIVRGERYAALLGQVAMSEAYAVYEAPAAAPAAIAGIAPVAPGAGELWFSCQPGLSGGVLAALVRRARAVLRSRRGDYPLGVMCLIEDGHGPGERLARLAGFVPGAVFLHGRREWIWRSDDG